MPWSPSPMAASSSVSHRRRSWTARAVQRSHASVTVMTVTDGTRATSSLPTGQSRGSLGRVQARSAAAATASTPAPPAAATAARTAPSTKGASVSRTRRPIRGIQLVERQVHGHGRAAQVQQHEDAVAGRSRPGRDGARPRPRGRWCPDARRSGRPPRRRGHRGRPAPPSRPRRAPRPRCGPPGRDRSRSCSVRLGATIPCPVRGTSRPGGLPVRGGGAGSYTTLAHEHPQRRPAPHAPVHRPPRGGARRRLRQP